MQEILEEIKREREKGKCLICGRIFREAIYRILKAELSEMTFDVIDKKFRCV